MWSDHEQIILDRPEEEPRPKEQWRLLVVISGCFFVLGVAGLVIEHPGGPLALAAGLILIQVRSLLKFFRMRDFSKHSIFYFLGKMSLSTCFIMWFVRINVNPLVLVITAILFVLSIVFARKAVKPEHPSK